VGQPLGIGIIGAGFIGQEVVTAGKLRLNRDIANQEIRQAEYAWQAQVKAVIRDEEIDGRCDVVGCWTAERMTAP